MIASLHFKDGKLAARDLTIEQMRACLAETGTILWVDIREPSAEEATAVLEGLFQFHPLTVEDCITETKYPKLEDYGDYIHLVMHAVELDSGPGEPFLTTELDLFVGKNYLVTFQRRALTAVQATFERVVRGSLTFRGPDRIAHAVLDHMVEGYKLPVNALRGEVETISEAVLRDPQHHLIKRIIAVRKQLSELRGLLRPQRAILAQLIAGKVKVVRQAMLPYLRDLQDDLVRLEDQAGAAQDQVLLSFRILLNQSSSEANKGIKVLTALTALATPIMLTSTWFAMNFEHSPLLQNPHAYPVAAAVTLIATIGMAVWLRAKRWM